MYRSPEPKSDSAPSTPRRLADRPADRHRRLPQDVLHLTIHLLREATRERGEPKRFEGVDVDRKPGGSWGGHPWSNDGRKGPKRSKGPLRTSIFGSVKSQDCWVESYGGTSWPGVSCTSPVSRFTTCFGCHEGPGSGSFDSRIPNRSILKVDVPL